MNGHESIAKLLLDKGALVNPKSLGYCSHTPLHYAAGNGHKRMTQLLLNTGADFNIKARVGSESQGVVDGTPLHCAAAYRHEERVKLLLDTGTDVNAKDGSYSYWTPLHYVAKKEHAVVCKLLDKGVVVNLNPSTPSKIPLHLAAERGYESIVKLFLDQGTNIDRRDGIFSLQTPLHRAAEG